MFGGHIDQHDYHYVGLYKDILEPFLFEAGFAKLEYVENLDIFEDASTIRIGGTLISLNTIAFK